MKHKSLFLKACILYLAAMYFPVLTVAGQTGDDSVYTDYPQFSWDHVPLYMHMRKTNAFTAEELEYLAEFPLVTIEKTTGSGTYGSSERGAIEAAKGIKAINPLTKVLYYRNVLVHYQNTYDVDTGLSSIVKPFLEDSSGEVNLHVGKRPLFDLSNEDVVEWWVDHAVEMSGREEIDGIFYDGIVKVISSYMESTIGTAKKQAVLEGFHTMMQECRARMDSSKINLGNLLRASNTNGGLDYLHYLDGSYLEGFNGSAAYLADGIELGQTAARNGNIICLTFGVDEILPSIDDLVEEDGYLVLPASARAVMDFYLAIFLVIAEKYSYFLIHDAYQAYSIMGDDRLWLRHFEDYDKPLGEPKAYATRSGYVYTRQFEHAAVWLDLANREARINWSSDSIPYPPEPGPVHEKFTLKFIIQEADGPRLISEALTELDSLSSLSNEAGQQFFALDSGLYHYSISKPGYFPVDSSINVHSDSVVYISLRSSTADVKFRIYADGLPLESASVTLGGDTVKTNAVGILVYQDVPVFSEYTWLASKPGYQTGSGSFILSADTTINVILGEATGIDPVSGSSLHVYPVPAGNEIYIESAKEIREICLIDLDGRIFYSEQVRDREYRIDLDGGIPSIFILRVINIDGTVGNRKVVRI